MKKLGFNEKAAKSPHDLIKTLLIRGTGDYKTIRLTILIITKKEIFSYSSRNYIRNKVRKFKNPFFDISFNLIYNIYIYIYI